MEGKKGKFGKLKTDETAGMRQDRRSTQPSEEEFRLHETVNATQHKKSTRPVKDQITNVRTLAGIDTRVT